MPELFVNKNFDKHESKNHKHHAIKDFSNHAHQVKSKMNLLCIN